MPWTDLKEHTGTLVALLGVLATVAGILFWNLMSGVARKIEHLCDWAMSQEKRCKENQRECRNEILEKMVTKEEFKAWQPGRAEIKCQIRNHEHLDGKVVIKSELL